MILVTGGNGHLGYNLVKSLVEKNYFVRTTVRDIDDLSKTKHLKNLKNVEIVQADLNDALSLENAMEGSSAIFHTAAPNMVWSAQPNEDIVKPILEGTKKLFYSAKKHQIKKIIFTSSASTCGMHNRGDGLIDETQWNNESTHPLLKAKIDAEKFIWNFSEKFKINVVTINPTLIIGPNFYRYTPSTQMYANILQKKFFSPPESGCHLVDVRDVADAHIQAYLNPHACGRYIVAGEYFKLSDLIKFLNQNYPDLKISERQIPFFILHILRGADWMQSRLLGRKRELTGEIIKDFIGKFQRVSTKKAQRDLNWHARSAKESIEDTFAWIQNNSNFIIK